MDTQDFTTELGQLQQCEATVRQGDHAALMARWQSGCYLNALRSGKKRLPNGMLKQLADTLGVSRSELTNRMKFATKFPTEADVTNAVGKFGSWHNIANHGLTDNPQTNSDDAPACTDETDSPDDGDKADYALAVLAKVVAVIDDIDSALLGDDGLALLERIAEGVERLRNGAKTLKVAA